jgi:hypothetical protein
VHVFALVLFVLSVAVTCWWFVVEGRAMKRRHERELREMIARHFMERFELECERIDWERMEEES